MESTAYQTIPTTLGNANANNNTNCYGSHQQEHGNLLTIHCDIALACQNEPSSTTYRSCKCPHTGNSSPSSDGVQTSSGLSIVTVLTIATVVVALTFFGQTRDSFVLHYQLQGMFHRSGSAFGYNLWQGLRRIYKAKLYKLYYLVTFWSGIFPYLKVAVLLGIVYCHFLIKSVYPVQLMTWIARVSVWSLIDVWVVALVCIIMTIHEEVKVSSFLRQVKTEDVEVEAVPLRGVVYLFGGLLLSQMCSVWYLHYCQQCRYREHPCQCLKHINLHERREITGYGTIPMSGYTYQPLHRVYDSAPQTETKTERTSAAALSIIAVPCLLTFLIWGIAYIPIFEIKCDVMRYHHFRHSYSLYQAFIRLHESSDDLTRHILAPICTFFVIVLPCTQYLLLIVVAAVVRFSTSISVSRIDQAIDLINTIAHFSSLEVFLFTVIILAREVGDLASHVDVLRKFIKVYVIVLPGVYYVLSCLLLLGCCKIFFLWEMARRHKFCNVSTIVRV